MSELLTDVEIDTLRGQLPNSRGTYRVMDRLCAQAKLANSAATAVECEWDEDDDGIWHTGCGNSFHFDDGSGPGENKQAFCGYCGKTLKETPYRDPEGEQDAK